MVLPFLRFKSLAGQGLELIKFLSNEINYQIKRYAKNEEVASFNLMNKGDSL